MLARVLGIPVERMILYTFLVNAALVALASFLVSPIYLAKFTNGELLGLAAFVAAIVGGFNQVRGAIVGGVLLGIVDNFVAAYWSSQYRAAIPAVPADRGDPVAAAGAARPRRGAHGVKKVLLLLLADCADRSARSASSPTASTCSASGW